MRGLTQTILVLGSVAILGSGCDNFLGESVATVGFFATHAGTPEGVDYPFYGDSETTRVFMTDTGYQVSLAEVYITTAMVRFIECGQSEGTPIEMFWGPCPEDFVNEDDLQATPLGAVTVTDGEYCSIDVEFGPFVLPMGADTHTPVQNPMIRDNTIVIVGVARRGEAPNIEEYPFEIVSDANVVAHVDVSELEDGGPVTLDNENFKRDLTLIKTYDKFFDGVDFATASPAMIEAAVIEALENQTRVHDGTFDMG